jgi:chain length determinant protein tyrosine kinase EpsG
MAHSFHPSRFASAEEHLEFKDTQPAQPERSIGELISEANNLSTEQIEQILRYQKDNGVRFGEAAVALGLANTDDVMWALAQQFHYPYASEGRNKLNPELVVATSPFTEQAEAFRTIRSHLIMKVYSSEGPRPALAILSPDSGDGKTYFAANLAAAFSQLPGRTLLIDADMRAPRIHELFGLPDRSGGLSSILSGRTASKVIQPVKELPNLYILPVGPTPPNPLELLERPAFDMLIRELKTKFDRILIDTPAMALGTDGAVIAARAGAALILSRQNKTRVDSLNQLVKTVQMGSSKLIGAIVNEF